MNGLVGIDPFIRLPRGVDDVTLAQDRLNVPGCAVVDYPLRLLLKNRGWDSE